MVMGNNVMLQRNIERRILCWASETTLHKQSSVVSRPISFKLETLKQRQKGSELHPSLYFPHLLVLELGPKVVCLSLSQLSKGVGVSRVRPVQVASDVLIMYYFNLLSEFKTNNLFLQRCDHRATCPL